MNTIKHPKYIVVIGASAGGLDALTGMQRHIDKLKEMLFDLQNQDTA